MPQCFHPLNSIGINVYSGGRCQLQILAQQLPGLCHPRASMSSCVQWESLDVSLPSKN
jgi:hypothetical protein